VDAGASDRRHLEIAPGGENGRLAGMSIPPRASEERTPKLEGCLADFLALVEEWIEGETEQQRQHHKSQHLLRSGTF